jgi:DNA-binding transcriptional regulator YdaS (Cro superfamily)
MPTMKVSTASQAIDLLGGTTATARLLGVLPSAVSNWRRKGFPERVHYRVARALEQRGAKARKIFEPKRVAR